MIRSGFQDQICPSELEWTQKQHVVKKWEFCPHLMQGKRGNLGHARKIHDYF